MKNKTKKMTQRRNAPTTSRARRKRRPTAHQHVRSLVQTTIKLKAKPNKVEYYPIPLGSIFSATTVGTDTDIRMVGYNLRFNIATGNNVSSVSVNLGHSGPWVRRAMKADDFNQQFTEQGVARSGYFSFKKRLLSPSEREYLSPHREDTNSLVLKVTDLCGVIPGATIKISAMIHYIRPHQASEVMGANDPATDQYEEQSVSNSSPSPPSGTNDIPQTILKDYTEYTTDSVSSPYEYTFTAGGSGKVIATISVTGGVNKVGIFQFSTETGAALQQKYAKNGYSGTITTPNAYRV